MLAYIKLNCVVNSSIDLTCLSGFLRDGDFLSSRRGDREVGWGSTQQRLLSRRSLSSDEGGQTSSPLTAFTTVPRKTNSFKDKWVKI